MKVSLLLMIACVPNFIKKLILTVSISPSFFLAFLFKQIKFKKYTPNALANHRNCFESCKGRDIYKPYKQEKYFFTT